VLLAPPSPISPEEPAATLTTSEGSRAVMREPWQPFFFLVADRFGMLSRVRNSRGRPLNAPDAFIHPKLSRRAVPAGCTITQRAANRQCDILRRGT
jgi:hypothetical protein